VFIIHRLPSEILDNTIGNIKYRNNVVTGEVATVNGNNTYDVYISGSDTAYPNVPTTLKEPDFEVGEAVEILIEYGNKEMPIIIGHAKKVAQEFVEDEINVLVTTLDAYSITTTTAYLEGRVEEIEGYENVIRRGFYYGTSTDYGNDIYSTGSFAPGSYNKQITGLTVGTTYHYQAYVHDAYNDVHKGEDKTMTTLGKLIAVIFNDYSDNIYLNFYNLSGTLVNSYNITSDGVYFENDYLCMDSQNNVYYRKPPKTLVKRGSNGVLMTSKEIINYPESLAVGIDSYIYVRESDGKVYKRSASDFSSQGSISLTAGKSYCGLFLDSDGNIYTVNENDEVMEKWSSVGVKLASHSISNKYYSTLGIADNYIIRATTYGDGYAYKMNKSLSENEVFFNLTDIYYEHAAGSLNNRYLFTGEKSDNSALLLEIYNTDNNLDKSINVGVGYLSLVAAYPF